MISEAVRRLQRKSKPFGVFVVVIVVLMVIAQRLFVGARIVSSSRGARGSETARGGPSNRHDDERSTVEPVSDDTALPTPSSVTTRRDARGDACSDPRRTKGDQLGKLAHARVAGTEFDMFVYGSSGVRDIVSDAIAGSGSWEREDTEKLMSLLSRDNSTKGSFLDVGANIGWFSMVASRLGHDVVAFEPFDSNVDLMCASLERARASSTKEMNFHLHQTGLDIKRRECELFQQKHVNIGDTHAVCDEKTRAHFLGNGYASLGWMNTTTLDDALRKGAFDHIDRVDVMKIDVEGFEPSVIAGGNQFFESKYAPRYVFMEMVSSLMDSAFGAKGRGKDELGATLLHLANHGYELDAYTDGGNGGAVSLQTSPIEDVRRVVDGKNALFVRRDDDGVRV